MQCQQQGRVAWMPALAVQSQGVVASCLLLQYLLCACSGRQLVSHSGSWVQISLQSCTVLRASSTQKLQEHQRRRRRSRRNEQQEMHTISQRHLEPKPLFRLCTSHAFVWACCWSPTITRFLVLGPFCTVVCDQQRPVLCMLFYCLSPLRLLKHCRKGPPGTDLQAIVQQGLQHTC